MSIKTEVDALKFVLWSDFRQADIKTGKYSLTGLIKALIHTKSSGKEREQCHREIETNYVGRSTENPKNVIEANMQLEYYMPLHFPRKKSEENGEQHLTDELEQETIFYCFRYGRTRLECTGSRKCKQTKKVDGLEVNSIKEKLEPKKLLRNGDRQVSGSRYFFDSEVLPSWTNSVKDEDSYDRNLMVE